MALKRTASRASISPPPAKRQSVSDQTAVPAHPKIHPTTTNSAVKSFFTPTSQKPKTEQSVTWTVLHQTLLVGHYRPERSGAQEERERGKRRKIAAFDLDGTLTKSKSGNRYPKDGEDWTWLYPTIPGLLKQLDAEGAQVVILSNQAGITLQSTSGKTPKSDLKRLQHFKTRLHGVLMQLDVPASVYAATARDRFRKPRPGMWKEMLEYYDLDDNEGPSEESFYVGDAGGRTADGGSGSSDKDFASSDRDLAANAGIYFRTPEEFFLGHDPRPFTRAFDPTFYLKRDGEVAAIEKRNEVDIVIFCGSPGAGKSTYYRNCLEPLGYKRVNQDILKSRDKCLKTAAEYLQEHKSVAVDNTNADQEVRGKWVELAKKFNVPIRCVLFRADPKLCEHNEAVRALNGTLLNPESRAALPKVAIAGFPKRYQEPSVKEGFQDIIEVEFAFRGTPEQQAIWSQYHI